MNKRQFVIKIAICPATVGMLGDVKTGFLLHKTAVFGGRYPITNDLDRAARYNAFEVASAICQLLAFREITTATYEEMADTRTEREVFCRRLEITASGGRSLISLANKAAEARQHGKNDADAVAQLEHYAAGLGITVSWPGFHPVFQKGDDTVLMPE